MATRERIPFVDLHAQYLAHKAEFDAALQRVIERSAYIGGEFVRRFETEFAATCGAKHCVAVGKGRDALYVVLAMLGVGLSAGNWISPLLFTLPWTAAHLYRMRVEERAMLEALGEPYRAYMARTWRLVPHIY